MADSGKISNNGVCIDDGWRWKLRFRVNNLLEGVVVMLVEMLLIELFGGEIGMAFPLKLAMKGFQSVATI